VHKWHLRVSPRTLLTPAVHFRNAGILPALFGPAALCSTLEHNLWEVARVQLSARRARAQMAYAGYRHFEVFRTNAVLTFHVHKKWTKNRKCNWIVENS